MLSTTPMTLSIDKAHSEVTFTVRHLITKVRGRFDEFEGVIEFNEEALQESRVRLSIKANSIDTNEPDRDTHLKSSDFFDVDKFSTIDFASTMVERLTQNQLQVTGNLSIHGTTKAVQVPVTFLGWATDPWGNRRAGFEGELTLSRKDFGLSWNAALEAGGFLVGDDVTIALSVQAIASA